MFLTSLTKTGKARRIFIVSVSPKFTMYIVNLGDTLTIKILLALPVLVKLVKHYIKVMEIADNNLTFVFFNLYLCILYHTN